MNVLNLSQSDWAKFQYDNMLALRSVGVHCDSVTASKHQFYKEQSEVIPDLVQLMERIGEYDVIQFFHDNVSLFNCILPALKNKKVISYHTSSEYRKNHKYINAVMNPVVYRSVNAMPEFMGLGAKNPVYMVGAVDVDKLCPQERFPGPCWFGHYPSNPEVKGTQKIVDVMDKLNCVFMHSTKLLPYDQQIERMRGCDVYIEMLTEKDGNGIPYGNFGITALEAAALGKVVITQLKHPEVYNEAYGFCGLNIANSAEKLKRMVESLDNYSDDYLKGQQQVTREWVVKNHSYKATGEYFLRNVLSEI